MNFINSIESEELSIQEATLKDCKRLQDIGATREDKELVSGEKFAPDYIEECLRSGDLPPIEGASSNG